MPPVYLGEREINPLIGNTQYGRVYVGSTLYFESDPYAAAWADNTPDYKTIPSGTWYGVAVDSGTLYVSDWIADRIARYTSWEDTTPDYKSLPDLNWFGLDVASGVIYLLDNRTDRIARYTSWADTTPDYKNIESRGTTWTGLAVDGSTIYALDTASTDRIARYTSWEDTTPDYKNLPTGGRWPGLAVADGVIYALDDQNNRIARYADWTDTTPEYKTLPNSGWEGLSLDDGRIYVMNDSLNRIARYQGDAAPPTPSGPTLRHTATITSGSSGSTIGYNAIGGWGSISDATYTTPAGTNVTIIHCRSLAGGLVFGLSGLTGTPASEFPTRIEVDGPSGGGTAVFAPGPAAPRTISGGVRVDYTRQSGPTIGWFSISQTSTIRLYY